MNLCFPQIGTQASLFASGSIAGEDSNLGAASRIQSHVTGAGLFKRVVLVTLIATGILTFLGATAHASPIRPDVKKLLSQPPVQMPQYVPARAGWNGSELSNARTAPNPTYESLGPAAAARELRAALFATMVPDFRIIALLGLAILLLRRIHKHEPVSATATAGANGMTVGHSLEPVATMPMANVEQERKEERAA